MASPTHPQNVLVTGGAGFIGSHLVEMLLARGCRVTVVDDQSTGNWDNLAAVKGHEGLETIDGSVTDARLVRDLVAGADVVYHLAASVGVQRIADAPIESIERNIAPMEILLGELHKQQLSGRDVKLFLASSSEVYGKNPKPQWTEQDDLVFGPTTCARWSYGAAKAIDEFLALAYHRQFALPVVIGRFFNVVGPRQKGQYGMVLPRLVERALSSESPIVHDDGAQTRCFAHVSDICRAVVDLMDAPTAVGQVFNIGSDQPVSIRELAERVIAAVNPKLQIEYQAYRDAYDADFEDIRRRVPDLSKLRRTIEHVPEYDLDAIIREVIEWKRSSSNPQSS